MAENRVIGDHGKLPWHLPEDLTFFKRTTLGHILVMGRKTYESIGKALPGRSTWVLSRSSSALPGVQVLPSLESLAAHAAQVSNDLFICGGADIYRQILPECGELFLTHVKRKAVGDSLFPPFERNFEPVANLLETSDFVITHYVNKRLLLA